MECGEGDIGVSVRAASVLDRLDVDDIRMTFGQ